MLAALGVEPATALIRPRFSPASLADQPVTQHLRLELLLRKTDHRTFPLLGHVPMLMTEVPERTLCSQWRASRLCPAPWFSVQVMRNLRGETDNAQGSQEAVRGPLGLVVGACKRRILMLMLGRPPPPPIWLPVLGRSGPDSLGLYCVTSGK